MKKYIVVLSFLMISALLMSCSGGKTSQKKDILSELEWETVEGGIEITNYSGTDKIVEVPEVIEGKKVVATDKKAFSGNVTIEELILPKSVERVGSLEGCTSLKVLRAPGAKNLGALPTSLKKLYLPAFEYGFGLSEEMPFDVLEIPNAKFVQNEGNVKNIVISEELKYYCYNEEGPSIKREASEYDKSVLITEENAAEIYCEFFGNDTVIVNGKTYSR